MTLHVMDCAALDERLADYLEDDLDPASRRQLESHAASCVRCAALVRDLVSLRGRVAELPELAPSRDLWSGIADRIGTPVVPLAARPARDGAARRPGRDRLRRAAIAAALVAVTAGVTYTITVARNGGRSDLTTLARVTRPAPADTNTTAGSDARSSEIVPAMTDLATTPLASPDQSETSGARASNRTSVRNEAAALTYSREIDRLRTIFARNRAQLDPRTAAIIEANLKVIDDAIAQSKAALAQDPASRFLENQLNSALDKKLELLKTAAFLPSRT